MVGLDVPCPGFFNFNGVTFGATWNGRYTKSGIDMEAGAMADGTPNGSSNGSKDGKQSGKWQPRFLRLASQVQGPRIDSVRTRAAVDVHHA